MEKVTPAKAIISVPAPEVIGGVSVLFSTLEPLLQSRGVKLHVIGKRQNERSPFAVATRLFRDWWNWYRQLRTLHPEVALVNPSLKYKSMIRDGVMIWLARLCGARPVSFFHGWSEDMEHSRWGRALFWLGIGRSSQLIVLGQAYREKLERMGFSKSIRTIVNPVSPAVLEHFRQRPLQPSNGGKQVILFLSRVETAKGVHELLDAFKQLTKTIPDLELRLAGDGSQLEILKHRAQAEGIENVKFLGFVQGEQKLTQLEQATLLVLPSYTEGIPLSVLEAMAAGLPVITTPVGGIPDFFEDGEMGFLVPPKNSEELFEVCQRVLQDEELRTKIARYNRNYSQTHLTPNCFVDNLFKILWESETPESSGN